MRVQRNYRGKKAQKDALMAMFAKSGKYSTAAARNIKAGTRLLKSGSNLKKGAFSFKPITLADALNPLKTGFYTFEESESRRMQRYIPQELEIYCKKNNNYQLIVNQLNFEQG